MTVMTDLNAISLTGTAKTAAAASGLDLASLVNSAKLHIIDLKTVLKTIVQFHPSTGGDSANYAALNAVIAELA